MDDAVDPGAAVGPGHLVVPDRDPGVLVADPARATDPRAADDAVPRPSGHRRTARAAPPGRVAAARRLAAMARRPDPRPPGERTAPRGRDGLGRPDPGPRRRRAVGQPVAPAPRRRRADERFPAILEMIPYGKDNWRRNADIARGEWLAARGYVLCRVDVRGTGIVRRGRPRRVHRRRDARRLRRGRMARRAAVVRRRRRDVGHQLRRLHLDPGRQAAAAPPARDRPDQATDDRYLDDVHYRGGCVTASELSQYAVSQVGDERDAARSGLPGRRLARRAGWRGSRRRRPGCSPGCASRPTGRTGGRARSPRTTTRSRPRSCTSAAGSTRTSTRRSGCRRAARRRSAPLVGNWVHGLARRRRRRARTSTSSTRSSASSIAGCKGIANGVDAEPPIVWFERDYADARAVPDVARPAAGGRPTPTRTRPPARASGGSAAARCRWSAARG